MPTRLITASMPRKWWMSSCSSCTSASITSTVGSRISSLAVSRRRLSTRTLRPRAASWLTSWVPTKPDPPRMQMRSIFMVRSSVYKALLILIARPPEFQHSLRLGGRSRRILARLHRAQPVLQQHRGLAETRRIIHGVAHHFLDVIARFSKRDRLDVDRGFHLLRIAPALRPAWSGVVSCGGEHRRAVQGVLHMLQVIRAEPDILGRILHLARMKALDPELSRNPARGGRHDLHQAGCADAGLRDADEAAFLPHQAEYPGFVDLVVARGLLRQFTIRGEKAQLQIVLFARTLGRVDGAVIPFLASCQLGGRQ